MQADHPVGIIGRTGHRSVANLPESSSRTHEPPSRIASRRSRRAKGQNTMQRWTSAAQPRAARSWRAWAAAFAAALLVAGGASAARAATNGIVIGDSLGVGVSMASGLTRLARNSVAIRGGAVVSQIQQAAPGSVVFMSLGTNDAVGRVDGLDGDIGRIVAASRGVKLVWIGPPCVLKAWDSNAERLDGMLRARLSGTGVTYVSMRDPGLCAPGSRAKDGVHFTMAGYGMMWSKARMAAGFEGGSRTMVASASPSRRAAKRRSARRTKLAKATTEPQAAIPSGAATASGAALPPEAPPRRGAKRRATADAER
jgi:hypothetical protein